MNIITILLKKRWIRKANFCYRKSNHYYKLFKKQILASSSVTKTNGKKFILTSYTQPIPFFLITISNPHFKKYLFYKRIYLVYQEKLNRLRIE